MKWLAAFLLLALSDAHAVILFRSGDPTENTTAPSGPGYANSGWQYEGDWIGFLGTPIAPHFFISAAHIGGGSVIVFHNATYHVTTGFNDPGSDLMIWKVVEPFPTFAPLYSRTDEVGQRLIAIGRGTQRGPAVVLDNVLKGWSWGGGDGVWRWGENIVSSIVPNNPTNDLLRVEFDANGLPNECHLSVGDSGGAAFMEDAGTWKLAGIHYAVDSFSTDSAGNGGFNAALFDRSGFYDQGSSGYVPVTGPSAFYSSRISSKLPWIASVVAEPQVGREGNDLTLTYTRFVVPSTDLVYAIEQSIDLINWMPVSPIDEVISTNASTQLVKAKVAMGTNQILFIRLTIARP